MNKYKITVNHNKTYIRKAVNCWHAIHRLCNQYGWNWQWVMFDSETVGVEWGECFIDKNGGINYNQYTLVERIH